MAATGRVFTSVEIAEIVVAITPTAVLGKFRDNASATLADEAVETLASSILALEHESDLSVCLAPLGLRVPAPA